MSIVVSCACGEKLKAKSELAGKRVKCPKCGQVYSLPKQNEDPPPIRFVCQCGQTLRAKPIHAGKRIKCPSCSQVVVIPGDLPNTSLPTNSSAPDPFGPSATSSASYDFGDWGDDPLGTGTLPGGQFPPAASSGWDSNLAGGLPAAFPVSSMPVADAHSAGTRHNSKRETMIAAAGYVAIGYGALQTLLSAYGIVYGIILLARVGKFSVFSLASSFPFSFGILALGVWLAKLGYEIVRGDRGALDRAGQASMVYIALAMMQLLFIAYGVIAGLGMARTNVLPFVFGLLLAAAFRLILVLPPAFILYVDRQYRSKQ